MPHYKCVGCKTRLYRAAARADLVGDLCPGCGALLEPVGELAEIVGFQSIERRTGSADDRLPSRHRQLANRVNDLFARRHAMRSQKPLEAGGSPRLETNR